jgi:hypothetical protein
MRKIFTGLCVSALVAVGGSELQAQVALGPEVSVAENVDAGIGLVVEAPLTSVNANLEVAGRFTLYFPDVIDYWEIEGDVRYLFPLADQPQLLPYVLGGIAIGHYSYDRDGPGERVSTGNTEVALRLGGGLKIPMDRAIPFIELGLGIGDLPDFTFRGGLTFPVG